MLKVICWISLIVIALPVQAAETLRLHGSNTVGAALAPLLVKRWLKQQGYMVIADKVTAPEERIITGLKDGEELFVEIRAHGSSTAFQSLEKGEADIGMASRPIKAKEIIQLAPLGQMDRPDSEYVIAIDGLAILVNKTNPLKQLSKSDLKAIFSGKITNWASLGLPPARIQVYARDNKSGTYDTFRNLVLGKKTPLVANAKRYESNAKLSDDVASDVHGIGFTGLAYIRNARALSVAEPGSVALFPTTFNVATEDYALARRLYLYLPKKNRLPLAASLIRFATSNQGQQLAAKAGFVSQQVFTIDSRIARTAPAEYRQLTQEAQRLSLNIRFKEGQTSLDNKAVHDIDRLVRFMGQPVNRGKRLMLMGFADNHETLPYYSLTLSIERADSVADMLTRLKVAPDKVRGFGQEVPVSTNETTQGRVRNRRVEVWLHDSGW